MSGRIKIADRDWTLDPGPFSVTGVQFSGAMPGGQARTVSPQVKALLGAKTAQEALERVKKLAAEVTA